MIVGACVATTLAPCRRSPEPPIGPPPVAVSPSQLAAVQGRWVVRPRAGAAGEPPIGWIDVDTTGGVAGVSVGRAGSDVPIAGPARAGAQYQRPRPGGGRVRLSGRVKIDGRVYDLVVMWADDPGEGHGGWITPGGIPESVMFELIPGAGGSGAGRGDPGG